MKIKNKRTYILPDQVHRVLVREENYNEQGHKLDDTEFDKDGDQITKSIYTYDAAGHLLNERLVGEEDSQVIEYSRNETGRITEAKTVYGDGSFERECIIYDAFTETHEHFDIDGELSEKSVLHYDANKKLVRSERADEMGELRVVEYEYDEKGLCTGQLIKDEEDGLVANVLFTYDEVGNLLEERMHDPDGDITRSRTNHYDENGNLTESEYIDEEQGVYRRYVNVYDEAGNVTESLEFWSEDSKPMVQVDYEYNEHGQETRAVSVDASRAGRSESSIVTIHEYEWEYFED